MKREKRQREKRGKPEGERIGRKEERKSVRQLDRDSQIAVHVIARKPIHTHTHIFSMKCTRKK